MEDTENKIIKQFEGKPVEIVHHNEKMWITGTTIGIALEYNN